MADIEQKIVITTETNADETAKKIDNLVESTEDSTQAQQKATKSTKAQREALEEIAPATSGFVKGLIATGKAMWALVANPLGIVLTAIAAVIGVLFLAFKSFVPIVDKVEQVFAALGAVINVVKNAFISVVTGTKSLSEAFSGLGDEMDDATDRTMALVKAQQDLDDAMASQEVRTAKNRAEINKLNVELRNRTKSDEERLAISEKIIAKEEADFKQRKKIVDEELRIAEEAIAIKAQFTDEEINQLKRVGDATKELAESRGGNYDEEYKALNSAKLKAIALEDEATTNLEKTYNRRDKIEDDRKAKEEKAATDRKARLDKELAERIRRNEAQLSAEKKLTQDIQNLQDKSEEDKLARQKQRDLAEITALEQKGIDVRKLLQLNTEKYNILEDELKAKRAQEIIEADKLRDEELRNADKKRNKEKNDSDAEKGRLALEQAKYFSDEQIRITEAEAEQKKAIQDAQLDVLSKGVDLVKNIFGKSKAVQKAAIIAENAVGIGKQIISNNTANTGALATPQAIATSGASAAPVIALNNISTGIGIASSVAATAKALSALGGGGASSGGQSGSASGGGVSAAPQVQFQGSSENQISNAVNQSQQNIQVTVLEKDISNAQGNVKALVSENSI